MRLPTRACVAVSSFQAEGEGSRNNCQNKAGLCLQENPGCGRGSAPAKQNTSSEMSLACNLKNNLTST